MAEEFWVFAYGSLMWNPGFTYVERRMAQLHDHKRSFCLASIRYRGTVENPGLVLALEPLKGALCQGIAFRVAAEDADEAYAYLQYRELVTASYLEKRLPLHIEGRDQPVESLCYVMDTQHEQYREGLSLEQRARIITASTGPAGPNRDYLFSTVDHLRQIGVEDAEMEAIAALVTEYINAEGTANPSAQ